MPKNETVTRAQEIKKINRALDKLRPKSEKIRAQMKALAARKSELERDQSAAPAETVLTTAPVPSAKRAPRVG